MGSFNPVHNGHLAIARYVIERRLADRVWFVVSPQNPFKEQSELAPFEDRLAMVRLGIEALAQSMGYIPENTCTGSDGSSWRGVNISGVDQTITPTTAVTSPSEAPLPFAVCDIEERMPRPSYTIHTVRKLQLRYPEHEFSLLVGSDVADELPRWHESATLTELVRFLIYPRKRGTCSPEMAEAPQLDVSSTELRAQAVRGDLDCETESAKIPRRVCEYVKSQNLYQMKTLRQLCDLIKAQPEVPQNYFERGRIHYRNNEFGKAINDFNRVLELDPSHTQARQMKDMTEAILNFRHFDIYTL